MFRKKKTALTVASVASAALIVSACANGDSDSVGVGFEDCDENPTTCNEGEAVDGDEIVWALDSGWASWSEVHTDYGQASGDVLEAVYPEAGYFDQDAEWHYNEHIYSAEPELVNEDPMQVEYYLNPEGTWGDGTRISVDDFIYNWYAWSGNEDYCNELCSPRSAGYGPHVDDIEETEEDVITITYRDGYQNPEWMFATVLTNPAHLAEEYGFEDWQDDPEVMGESLENFVTTTPEYSAGPYKIVDAEMNDYVSLEINEEYDGAVQPTISNIRLEFIESTASIITELRQGTIHGASPGRFDPDDLDALEGEQGIRYDVADGPGWAHLDLNMENQFLQDFDLRHAIFVAYNLEEILDRTTRMQQEDSERVQNFFFVNDDDMGDDIFADSDQGSGDMEAARSILEDADYEWDDNETLLTPEGDEVELEYRLPTEGDNSQVQAELFQSWMGELGINVELNSFGDGELNDVLADGTYDVINFQWLTTPTFATSPQQLFGTGSGSNFGGYSNDEFDDLADQVLGTVDMDEAAQHANDAARVLAEDAYVLPMSAVPAIIMIDENLVNVRDNWASQQRALYNMAEWGWNADDAED